MDKTINEQLVELECYRKSFNKLILWKEFTFENHY